MTRFRISLPAAAESGPVVHWTNHPITSSVRWATTSPIKTSPPARHIQEGHVSHLHTHLPVGISQFIICIINQHKCSFECKRHTHSMRTHT